MHTFSIVFTDLIVKEEILKLVIIFNYKWDDMQEQAIRTILIKESIYKLWEKL